MLGSRVCQSSVGRGVGFFVRRLKVINDWMGDAIKVLLFGIRKGWRFCC